MTKSHYIKSITLTVLLVACIFCAYVIIHELRHGILRVVFLDVGQGDAIYIESPNGTQFLIDGGPGRSVLARLGEVMPFYDRSIDMVMETHPDHDHSGGLPYVLAQYEVDGLMRTSGSEQDADSAIIIEKANKTGLMMVTAKRGQIIDLGGGAKLEILFPDRLLEETDTNLKSIVSLLSYGDTKALFMSDAPQSIEHYLMRLDNTDLRADVLKNGHHGSKTSSAPDFISLVNPKFAILSSGKNNRYGHPNKEVTDLLAKMQITTIRTDERGSIELNSDGTSFTYRR